MDSLKAKNFLSLVSSEEAVSETGNMRGIQNKGGSLMLRRLGASWKNSES